MAKQSTEVLCIDLPSLGFTLKARADIDGKQSAYKARVTEDGEFPEVDYTANVACGFKFNDSSEPIPYNPQDRQPLKHLPVFFETRYFFRGSFKRGEEPRDVIVSHRMASVVDSFSYEDGILVGTLDFINEPGRFRLDLRVINKDKSEQLLSFEFMVVSVKMNVARDYREIVKTIEEAKPGIVNAFLSKTFHGVALSHDDQTEREWYEIFDEVFDYYEKACRRIVLNPHLRYVKETEWRRADRIKRWTPALANRYNRMDKDKRPYAVFQTERITAEENTPENRFVLHTLRTLSERLQSFIDTYKDKSQVAGQWCDDNVARVKRLKKLAHNAFFRGVGRFEGFKQQSLVMQKRAGYAQVWTVWLKLKLALRPGGDDLDVGFRPISTLYEFWCFLKMQKLLKELLAVEPKTNWQTDAAKELLETDDLLDGDSGGRILSKIDSTFEKDGTKYILSYQKTYSLTENEDDTFAHLNPQRPDIVLSIIDGGKTYTYLFDAKYRVWSVPGKGQDGADADASPRAAIDDMHRYRDAILYRSQKAQINHEIIGAYVLYPGRQEPHLYKDYDRSIEAENIGAIPLLPTFDEKLKAFLERIVMFRGADHLGKAITVRGTSIILSDTHEEYLVDNVIWETRKGDGGKLLQWIDTAAAFYLEDRGDPEAEKIVYSKKQLIVLTLKPEKGDEEIEHVILKIRAYLQPVTWETLTTDYMYYGIPPRNPSEKKYHVFLVEIPEKNLHSPSPPGK